MCSPRAWGWTGRPAVPADFPDVFPTGVGMDRNRSRTCPVYLCVPHGRGDGPPPSTDFRNVGACSPRAWGWTVRVLRRGRGASVFPTGVGMDRRRRRRAASRSSVPHGRGDGPVQPASVSSSSTCSPRAWGWTASSGNGEAPVAVFPTGVGMDRYRRASPNRGTGVPHGRGDGPELISDGDGLDMCSPRAWGWTVALQIESGSASVFPTGVGMDRQSQSVIDPLTGVPHGRGDGPATKSSTTTSGKCSPRAWGWPGLPNQRDMLVEVFPTGVGMGRKLYRDHCRYNCVPHGRGDGPVR